MKRVIVLCVALLLFATATSDSLGRAPATAAALMGQITIKPDSKAAERVQPPVVSVSSITPPSEKSGLRYGLKVTYPQPFRADWYQSLEHVLPPNPCSMGGTDKRLTNMRMEVYVSLIRGGKTIRTDCYPVEKIAIDFYIDAGNQPLLDTDAVRVTFEDRADGARYESQPYLIGWYGVANVLTTVGCKYFLGRAGSYLCTTDKGMSVCENLKKQGKPIQCTRAGKPAK